MAVMASNRSKANTNTNTNSNASARQGLPLPLKPQLHPQSSSAAAAAAASSRPPPKTPVSRRLVPNTSSAVFRPKLADPSSVARPPPPPPPPSSLQPEETEKLLFGSNVTPRSSSRKSRVNSNHSTPQDNDHDHSYAYTHTHAHTHIHDRDHDDTPSHAKKRPHMTSPTNSEPVSRRPQVAERPNLSKARSAVGQSRPTVSRNLASTTRPTVRGYVTTKDAAKSPAPAPAPASTFGSHLSTRNTPTVSTPVHRPVSARSTKDSRPMFFHANEARSQPSSHEKQPPLKKTPTFFYANGTHEEHSAKPPSFGSSSPALSAVSDSRSPQLLVQSPSEPPHSSPMLSPPLSAVSGVSGVSGVSSRSPYFPAPAVVSPSAILAATSPPVAPSTSPPKGNIHLSYRKGVSQIIGMGGLPFPPTQRKTSLNSVQSAHVKSNSLSSIDSGSPGFPRRQSQPLSHPVPLSTADGTVESPTIAPPGPFLPTLNTNVDSASEHESLQSPVKPGIDIHAEARRERKVLDLEISNSSLLAINKSLEREIRKQKAELKRFRRLSRAGQFAIPEKQNLPDDLSTLDEEADHLPGFDQDEDGYARPSSPFLEQPSEDYSDEDSVGSSAVPLSPSAQADRDAARRVEDENHLRLDLSRHRELLLDTQRMNQSLQKCLYWTEGLIKDGKKALEYQVASSDVKLGGHILSPDDIDDNSSQIGYPESISDQQLQVQQDAGQPDRRSVGSEMDSGIDLGKRGPLIMSRSNPHHTQPS